MIDNTPVNIEDFCNYFDFTFYKEDGYVDTDNYEGRYKYRASDNQGTLSDRYAMNVSEFATAFDVLLIDYVERILDDYNFEVSDGEDYYKKALNWIVNTELKGTDTYDVIRVINNPELLVEN